VYVEGKNRFGTDGDEARHRTGQEYKRYRWLGEIVLAERATEDRLQAGNRRRHSQHAGLSRRCSIRYRNDKTDTRQSRREKRRKRPNGARHKVSSRYLRASPAVSVQFGWRDVRYLRHERVSEMR